MEWGYLSIFFGIIATGLGLPMPEEVPVVVGGILSGTVQDGQPLARWWIMLPVCIVAVIIGDSCLYFIGRIWGAKLVERPFIKKHILPPERLKKIEENFHNYGIRILLFARLTPGIRAPIFLTAGITKLSVARFVIADSIYAVPGVSLLFYLGYVFTEQARHFIEHEGKAIKAIIILVVVLAVAGYFLYRFLRKPHVTGGPEEMPQITEEVVHSLESMAGKILHKDLDHRRAKETYVGPPPALSQLPQTAAQPPPPRETPPGPAASPSPGASPSSTQSEVNGQVRIPSTDAPAAKPENKPV